MFTRIISSVVLLFLIILSPILAEDDPTSITLPYGQIKGHVLQTANGNNYYAFQEIPYAAPPVNTLRFKEPVAPSKWIGTLETTKNTKICYQQQRPGSPVDAVESEDCLYLNVYVPANATDALPVLVWIHGGGYIYGDGTFQIYGPQFLIDYDIIIVSLNYRLGVLGFLTTEDEVIPGNLAIKDQNIALRWVKDNIHLFGGDPDKITIAGESAGGTSVGLHLISKKSEGLFRGAILESLTAIGPIAYQPFAKYLAFEVGRTLDSNFTSENSTELLNLLQSLPAAAIAQVQVTSPSKYDTFPIPWRPVIEDENLEGAYITGPMHEDIKNGNIHRVPILTGFNSEEALTLIANNSLPNAVLGGGTLPLLKQLAVLADTDLSTLTGLFNIKKEDRNTAGSKIREIYTNSTFTKDVGAMVRYISDWGFTIPVIRNADLSSNFTDVYLYQFSYNGLLGTQVLLGGETVNIEGLDPNAIGHAEELWYLFDLGSNTDITKFPARDRLVQGYLLRLWSNFVKYLNPTPRQDPALQNVIWTPVSPNKLNYLNINATLSIQTDPKDYKKWKEIIDEYAIPPLIVY